jgi:glucose/arabinose dehydrogenase
VTTKIENNKTIIQESIPIGQRVRDVRGRERWINLYSTDEQNGQLIRLEPQ